MKSGRRTISCNTTKNNLLFPANYQEIIDKGGLPARLPEDFPGISYETSFHTCL
jgi:hypothetical protein